MNITDSRKLILIPLALFAGRPGGLWLLWNSIPTDLTVHFSPTGDPVTLMSRVASLLFSIAALLLVLSIYSWRLGRHEANPTRALVRYYFTVSLMTIIFFAILLANA